MGLDHLKVQENSTEKEIKQQENFYKDLYNSYHSPEYKNFFAKLVKESLLLIEEHFEGVSIEAHGRIKSENSFYRKVDTKIDDFSDYLKGLAPKTDSMLYDTFGFRVVVEKVDDEYIPKNESTAKAKRDLNLARRQLAKASKRVTNAKIHSSSANLDLDSAKNIVSNIEEQITSQFVPNVEDFQEQVDSFSEQYKKSLESFEHLKSKYNELLSNSENVSDYESFFKESLKNAEENLKTADANLKKAKINLFNAQENLKSNRFNLSNAHNEVKIAENNLKTALEDFENSKVDFENCKKSVQSAEDSLNIAVSTEITDFLTTEGSPLLEKTSAKNIPARERNYNKPNGYIANQRTVSFSPNNAEEEIYVELQFRSKYRDDVARGNHGEYKQQEKLFPEEQFFACKSKEDFDKLLRDVPSYIIRTENGDVKELSPYSNFLYYYSDYFYEKCPEVPTKLIHEDAFNKLYHSDFINTDTNSISSDSEEVDR